MKKKTPTVFIVGTNHTIRMLFDGRGIAVVQKIKDASFIQFTGGGDISPQFYDQARHEKTYSQEKRDFVEATLARLLFKDKIPMAGICRGGQLLNVLCGGDMWQDVDGHKTTHRVYAKDTKKIFRVSSVHHQLMIPTKKNSKILLVANETTEKHRFTKGIGGTPIRVDNSKNSLITHDTEIKDGTDVEAVMYPKYRCLCFQGHPEYPGTPEFTDYYFYALAKYLKIKM